MHEKVPIETVKSVFCKINGTSPVWLPSRSKERRTVETRRMIWWYLRENTPMTLSELGEIFNRDHSSTLHNLSKHAESTSITPTGVLYDIDYTERYRAGVLELKHIINLGEDAKVYRNYMLTYYNHATEEYMAPVVRATSIMEAIIEYEQYNAITDEELLIAKAL